MDVATVMPLINFLSLEIRVPNPSLRFETRCSQREAGLTVKPHLHLLTMSSLPNVQRTVLLSETYFKKDQKGVTKSIK